MAETLPAVTRYGLTQRLAPVSQGRPASLDVVKSELNDLKSKIDYGFLSGQRVAQEYVTIIEGMNESA